jgi:hypothetical protein
MKMKIKLWVDDIRNAPDSSWTVVRTNEEAIRVIAMFGCVEISLDHDIENTPETFKPIVYFLGEKYAGQNIVPRVTIHSANPVGTTRMKNILEQYGLSCVVKPIYET